MFGSSYMDWIKKNPKLSEPYYSGMNKILGSAAIQGPEALPGKIPGPTAFTSQQNAAVGDMSETSPNNWNTFFNKNVLDMMQEPSPGSSTTAESMQEVLGEGEGASTGLQDLLVKGPGGGGFSISDAFSKIFSPANIATVAARPLGQALGGRTGGDIAGALAATGIAAAQGGMNPVSDIMALMSILKATRLFG
jgi:hypothetical protein